ncbi:hypothetical protein [Mycoplana ramosa]|uniref:Uncharacterized protein n=1 Tax=Mycoplana ramosa TaxID=40837 RepID=A0ABW3Z273_MYCRA
MFVYPVVSRAVESFNQGKSVPNFCSFMIFESSQTELVGRMCKEAEWDVRFIPDPSTRFQFYPEGGVCELSNTNFVAKYGGLRDGAAYGQLLVIQAGEADATNIVNLIQASSDVQEGFPDATVHSSVLEIPDDPSEQVSLFENVFKKPGFFERFSFKAERPIAVAMATRAWADRRTSYAIHKLSRSYQTEAVTPWSLHPRRGQIFDKHSNLLSDHVTSSIAINLAYSAIEELDLGIKSSVKKPRWIDNASHTWNPDVLQDIESRLEQVGITPDRGLEWIIRGEPTEVVMEPVRPQLRCQTADEIVRDVRYTFPDAIHACSFLRNFKTAHAFSRDTPRIGPYEVYNVQQVARSLILSKCGLWGVSAANLREQLNRIIMGVGENP